MLGSAPTASILLSAGSGQVTLLRGPDWETTDTLKWSDYDGGCAIKVVFSSDSARVAYCVPRMVDQATSRRHTKTALWSIANSKYDFEVLSPADAKTGKAVSLSPDSTTIACSSVQRTELHSVQTGQIIGILNHQGHMISRAYSPNGTILVEGTEETDKSTCGVVLTGNVWRNLQPTQSK